MQLVTPDYGRGVEFACYRCDVYGRRFVDSSPAGRAASDAARSASAINAVGYLDAAPLNSEERELARQNMLRILHALEESRPGTEGDEVRAEIARLEGLAPLAGLR